MSSSSTGESSWNSLGSIAERSSNDLNNDLHGKGVPLLRISKSYKLKKILMLFSNMDDGLHYLPASGKHSLLLFANMSAIRALSNSDDVCRKAHLSQFQHCVQVESQFGWSWYLICCTDLDRRTWVDFLEQRRRSYLLESRTNVVDVGIARYWSTAALRGKSKLSFNEVSALFKNLFGHIPPDEFAQRFRVCDSDSDTYLDYDEFRSLFAYFNEVEAVQNIYATETANRQSGMSAAEFTRFCTSNDGGSNMTPMRCAALFQLFTNRQTERLHAHAFTAFLLHPQQNSIVDQRQLRVVDCMDFPLHHYFISSSHNTYLTGNQLSSESSCSTYRDVLHAGCRCVEIDCWDGPDGQPIVYHGHTMTTKIRFGDVIRTIHAHAFQNPASAETGASWNPREFPVILSLEVHTCAEQTDRMAAIMKDVFGDRLFLSRQNVADYTPAKLQGKILVKWKMNAAGIEEVKDTTGSGIRADRQISLGGTGSALSACASVGSVKTSTWGAEEQPYHVESFTEGEAGRLGMVEPLNFTLQNSRMLARTYPLGARIDSSNYDPMPLWRLGCQMVALNWQTRDNFLRVNEGFFDHRNGGCGYVLKPPYLRDVGSAIATNPFALMLRVICGSHLHTTFDGVDATHVSLRLWIHGAFSQVELPLIPSAAYPQWNVTVRLRGEYRELDILCLRVVARTASGNMYDVSTSCLPVNVLRCGYHAIPLRHAKTGQMADIASVLCHLSFSTPCASSAAPAGGPTTAESRVLPYTRRVL
jgi:phosphatidylinositol phospholipase C, delta